MFSNWRQTSGSVLVPHVVPMISGSKLGSDAVPSGSYYDIGGVSSVTPLLCSGEGIVVVAEKWRVPNPGKLSAVAGGIVSGAEIGHHVVPSGSRQPPQWEWSWLQPSLDLRALHQQLGSRSALRQAVARQCISS